MKLNVSFTEMFEFAEKTERSVEQWAEIIVVDAIGSKLGSSFNIIISDVRGGTTRRLIDGESVTDIEYQVQMPGNSSFSQSKFDEVQMIMVGQVFQVNQVEESLSGIIILNLTASPSSSPTSASPTTAGPSTASPSSSPTS